MSNHTADRILVALKATGLSPFKVDRNSVAMKATTDGNANSRLTRYWKLLNLRLSGMSTLTVDRVLVALKLRFLTPTIDGKHSAVQVLDSSESYDYRLR